MPNNADASILDSLGKAKRAESILKILEDKYPLEPSFLVYKNAFELLIGVILSAQTTDIQVNKVSPALFERFPDPKHMAAAPLPELEFLVHSCGFYKTKAKNIKETSRLLQENFAGTVPGSMEELVQLAGVGRKSAGVILHHIYGKPALIVDTHFGRVMRRLGLANSEDPGILETELASYLEPRSWGSWSMRANAYGRDVCHSRKPQCSSCVLAMLCPSLGLYVR